MSLKLVPFERGAVSYAPSVVTMVWFRKGKGTRDAIATLRVMGEISLQRGKDLCICFVDHEKAFDRVDWWKMMWMLKDIGVDWRDRNLIAKLYLGQRAELMENYLATASSDKELDKNVLCLHYCLTFISSMSSTKHWRIYRKESKWEVC